MKILVLSDSHGHEMQLINIIRKYSDADAIIFLGDGEFDFEKAIKTCGVGEEKIICQVSGNRDSSGRKPKVIIREFGAMNFFMTHGDEQNIKYGLWRLIDEAKQQKCSVVLFGHTHIKSFREIDGIILINPGSVMDGKYCVIEVEGSSVSVVE